MDSTRLRELRAGRRISLEKLAEVIGKSIVSYSKKESGGSNSDRTKLLHYVNFMGFHTKK